jgi:non-specific serine/threonine protein kinase/serine/threonine-protein kinase
MIFDLYDRIKELPGSTSARQVLVTEALQYLDGLAKEAVNDSDLALELADAYARVGEVQFDSSLANLGDISGALGSYGSARRILEGELARTRGNLTAQRLLARVYLLTASAQLRLGRTAHARASVEAGLRLREALARTGSENDRRDLAGAYHRLADVAELGDRIDSLAPRRKALEMFEALLILHPDDREAQRSAALAHKTLGSTLLELHRAAEARSEVLKALELDEKRTGADPNSALAQLDLSFDLSLLASLSANQGDFAGAVAYWQRTIRVRRSLVDADPRDVRARDRLVFAYLWSSEARRNLNDPRGAIKDATNALTLSEAMASANPDDGLIRSYAAQALAKIGLAEQALAARSRGRERIASHMRACAAFARSLDAYKANEARGTGGDRSDREDSVAVGRQLASCRIE